jgi:hypothetical protein
MNIGQDENRLPFCLGWKNLDRANRDVMSSMRAVALFVSLRPWRAPSITSPTKEPAGQAQGLGGRSGICRFAVPALVF